MLHNERCNEGFLETRSGEEVSQIRFPRNRFRESAQRRGESSDEQNRVEKGRDGSARKNGIDGAKIMKAGTGNEAHRYTPP